MNIIFVVLQNDFQKLDSEFKHKSI